MPALTGSAGDIEPPATGSHAVDHHACYKAKVTRGTPRFAPVRDVAVGDPLSGATRLLDLTGISRLCLAADKNGEGVVQPGARLLCYRAKLSKGQPKHARVQGLRVADQFGLARVDTVKEIELCLPATGAGGVVNQAPVVDAGPDLTITLPGTAVLAGTATDDGLPAAALTVAWTVDSGPGTVTFDDPAAASTTASFTEAGTYVLRLTASDGELSRSDDVTVTVDPDPDPGLPPDPATVAPPVSPTVAARFADATSFLHGGPDPIQTGVAPGTIDAPRAAVLRGLVLDQAGLPLPGVVVRVLHHAEFGQTLTRADGWFDLAVTGGAPLTVSYERAGYLPAQRRVEVPWQDWALLPDVVLVSLDARATAIDLTAAVPMQVARGNAVTDADGTRQATLLFPQGTQATMVLPDGRQQPLTTLTVRATEYTVGDAGPLAMPGELPPTSGYTYAVELSADEALAAGAVRVQFSQPVILHVENFVGFPVGGVVPAGFYDRVRGAWIPSDNGRVIAVLAVSSGLAELDVDGDGAADTGAALAALGITDAERERLAALYAPGQTLWRVPIPHFTPWDCNWPYGPPDDAVPPDQPAPQPDPPMPDPTCEEGCAIEVENQVLGEGIPLVGTPFVLNYRSDRVPGRRANRGLDIRLTGPAVPASLARVELEVLIAGRRIRESFAPAPDLRHRFVWDGLDAYGRPLPGAHPVTVRIGYTYAAVFYLEPAASARSFGRVSTSGVRIVGDRATNVLTIWREFGAASPRLHLGEFSPLELALGGWTLDVHHAYDPAAQVLYLGNGRRVAAVAERAGVIDTVAGNGQQLFSGDGGPAVGAGMDAGPVVADRDGTLYMADALNHRIRRITPDGIISTVVGTGVGGFSDGGSVGIRVNAPQGLALGPGGVAEIPFVDENGQPGVRREPRPFLYFADTNNARIRAITAFGGQFFTQTVAGTGQRGGAGDEGPATLAQLDLPTGLAAGPDGSLYIVETGGHRIRHVLPDGRITTLAGTGQPGFSGDGGPARLARLNAPYHGIAVGRDGSVYFTDTGNHRVRRIAPDGTISTVAGTGVPGFNGDDQAATAARLNEPNGLDVHPSGSLLIADTGNHRLRAVGRDGRITTLAGTGQAGFAGDRGPARAARLAFPVSVRVLPDASLLVTDHGNLRLRTITSSLPFFDGQDLLVAHPDGSQLLRFDPDGRHLATVHALTGGRLHAFGYDGAGRLTSVTDGDGNVTTIERGPAGEPTAVVGPFGHRSELSVDGGGYLSAVTDPAGSTTGLTHTPDGLLVQVTGPRNGVRRNVFDDEGRLTRHEDAAGRVTVLARTLVPDGYQVTLTSPAGRVSTHLVETRPDGGERRVRTLPDGLAEQTLIAADGTRTVTHPDGTVITTVSGPDPRWGMQAPLVVSRTIRTPAGLTRTEGRVRTVSLAAASDVSSLQTQTDLDTVNGRTTSTVYDAAARQFTVTSPEGRQVRTTVDTLGRIVQVEVPGLHPTRLVHDARGLLVALTQGDGPDMRALTMEYSAGLLTRFTDPLGRARVFERDAAGRPTRETRADGGQLALAYDASGNLVSVAPPGRPAHTFAYSAVDELETHAAPDAGAGPAVTTFAYDLDGNPRREVLPGGAIVDLAHDAGARLSGITIARGAYAYAYDPGSGRIAAATAPGGESLAYRHDGGLLLDTTWAGTVAGSVARTRDADFRIASERVNGGPPVVRQYDGDGLLVQAGALAIVRDPAHGEITGTTLGIVADERTITGFGDLGEYRVEAGATPLLAARYERDASGRITRITETVQGATSVTDYAYDVVGRLVEVWRDGQLAASYTYDANGNRLTHTSPAGTTASTYDDRDRLLEYGAARLDHAPAGELASWTAGGLTTTYEYDARGNLVAVTLPAGTRIDYVIDAQDRRVAKRVNGVLRQGFLYRDAFAPVAELDGSGTVVSQFVYGTREHVPDYLIRDGQTYRIVTDHLGSPRLVVDAATGAVAQRLDYDEFGRVVLDTNPGFQPFGFAGGLHDVDTGLTRFGVRDYDARTGRWTAPDPLRFAGGSNLYAYVNNDPVNLIDPTGTGLLDDLQMTAQEVLELAQQPPGELTRRLRDLVDSGRLTKDQQLKLRKALQTLKLNAKMGRIVLRCSILLSWIPDLIDLILEGEIPTCDPCESICIPPLDPVTGPQCA